MKKSFFVMNIVIVCGILSACAVKPNVGTTADVAVTTVDLNQVQAYIYRACALATIDVFGSDFNQSEKAINYCYKDIWSYFSSYGWPGPQLSKNSTQYSAGYDVAKQVAISWSTLDLSELSFVYRNENVINKLMDNFKKVRLEMEKEEIITPQPNQ